MKLTEIIFRAKFTDLLGRVSSAFASSANRVDRNMNYEIELSKRAGQRKMSQQKYEDHLLSDDGYKYCDEPALTALRKYIQGKRSDA